MQRTEYSARANDVVSLCHRSDYVRTPNSERSEGGRIMRLKVFLLLVLSDEPSSYYRTSFPKPGKKAHG